MKFIFLSDWHIRSTTPSCRSDNFQSAQFKKLQQLIQWSNEHNARILCGGDMLDSNRISYRTYNELQQVLFKARLRPIVVRGNHDSYYQTDITSAAPIDALDAAGAINLYNVGSVEFDDEVVVCPCSWAQEPLKPAPNKFNILLMHAPVFEKTVPHFFKEAFTVKTIKKKYPGYDLYLCGDIHVPFFKERVCVSGSMTRTTVIQKDYQPRAYLFDTTNIDSPELLYFSIKEDVFNETLTEVSDEEFSQTLRDLVQAIETAELSKVDFESECRRLSATPEIYQKVEEIIEHVKEA